MIFFGPESDSTAGTSYQRPPDPVADDFIRDVKVTAEAFDAGRDAATFIDNSMGYLYAREEAYDRRNKAIKEATGVDLPNPMRQPILQRTGPDPTRAASLVPGPPGPQEIDASLAENVRQYEQRRRELADANAEDPAVVAAIAAWRPIDDEVKLLAKDVERQAGAALSAPSSRPWLKWGGYFAGAMAGGFRDPLNVASLVFGGGPSTAKTAAGAIVRTALREGIVNASAEAAMQPAIQKWRSELGLEAGLGEAAQNVAMAFGFGAVVGGAVEGVRSAARARHPSADLPHFDTSAASAREPALPDGGAARGQQEPPLIAQALAGDEEALISAAREAGDGLDPAALAAADALEADRLVRGLAPEGIAPRDHELNLSQAVRFAEDPDGEMPPLPFDPVPTRSADAPPLPDASVGQRFEYLKKPVTFEPVSAATLRTDAATFQYKGGGDAAGVTDRLRSVERWDDLASGKVVVFEDEAGQRFIADGHQRLGLAQRLLLEGRADKIDLNGFVFRARDGWTPADVRAIAAKKNLQEGSGDVIDTARVLRERPTILDGSVPVGSEHMRQARGLARLSDDAFVMVLNRQVAPGHAALVGEMMPERLSHAFAVAALAQAEDLTAARARYMIADMARAPIRHEVQETLLGALERTVPLVVERARVLDKAVGALRKERSAFRTVVANADRLENAGNVITEGGSRAAADAAAEAIDAIERLALRAGAVSEALDRAATALAGGTRIAEATDAFVREVTALVEQRGILGLATEETRPRAAFDLPTGPEATRQADTLQASLFDQPAAGDAPRADAGRADVATLEARIKDLEQQAAQRSIPETRGSGTQFHGTSNRDFTPDDWHSSALNYYGAGLYTTDALDVAIGYSRKGARRGEPGAIFTIAEKRPLKILDGEAKLPPDLTDRFRQIGDDAVQMSLDEKPANLRELYDLVRENGTDEGLSGGEIQDIFDSMRYHLEQAGYDGFSHAGGLRTGAKAHNVVIYFKPDQDLAVQPAEAFTAAEAKRTEIARQLAEARQQLAERRLLDDVTHSEDMMLGARNCALGGGNG